MPQTLDGLRNSLSRSDISNLSDLREIEIAYYLQNSQPGDLNLVEILVKTYAEETLWLIQILLNEPSVTNPPSEKTQNILINTFTQAIIHVDRFWGELSVRNWLYAQAVSALRAYTRRFGIALPLIKKKQARDYRTSSEQSQNGDGIRIESLNDFTDKQRQLMLMHYVLHLGANDVAGILNIKVERVRKWLREIRTRLLRDNHFTDEFQQEVKTIHQREVHQANRTRIHDRMDGILEKSSKGELLLREHLLECDACNKYAEAMEHLDGQLVNVLNENYPRPHFSGKKLEQLMQSVKIKLTRSGTRLSFGETLRKGMWMFLIIMLFASGVFTLMRITPDRGEFPATPTPTERILPTPIGLNEEPIIEEEKMEALQFAIYALEPQMSTDHRWIVFSSNAHISEVGDFKNTFDLLLYDTQSQSIKRIEPEVMSFNGDLFSSPDISRDGRWIVYSGVIDAYGTGDMPCLTETYEDCRDIILYDRINDSHKRITINYDGGSSNGNSFMPSISENGRWIVFLSKASNLMEGDLEICGADGEDASCTGYFIYDRINEQIEQIPISSINSFDMESSGFLGSTDVTDDGRYLLISLTKYNPNAGQEELNNNEVDLYIYDREEKVLEPVDVASDGANGDGSAFSGQMTPDGRYVIFSSTSTNLVPGDENGFGDVFLRDRLNGKTEIISTASDGTPANGDSGNNLGILYRSFDITDDGRHVVFMSAASNLDPGSSMYCRPLDNMECIYIYVRDRFTGDVEKIVSPQDYNSLLVLPNISNDGRWISYMQVNYDCDMEVCVDMNLYDRERGWTSEVTRNIFPRTDIQWELDTILEPSTSNMSAIDYSPDGETVALITDRTVKVVSVVSGEELLALQGNTDARILTISFSPDGRFIAGGSSDGCVNIWRISDGSLAYLLKAHPGRIIDMQFSPNGEYLYVATPQSVWIWQRTDRKFTRVYTESYEDIYIKDVDISPTLELMAIMPANEPFIWIQRLPGGDVIHRLAGSGNKSHVSFSPDGKYLSVQFIDGPLQIWQLDIDALGVVIPILIKEVNFPDQLIGKVRFSPDGVHAAVGSMNGEVLMLEVPSGINYVVPDSYSFSYVSDLAFSPSGEKLVATMRDGIYFWRKTKLVEDTDFFTVINTDEFIQIPNRRRPLRNVEASLDLDRIAIEGLTLYQADDQTSFEVFAPSRLPDNVSYVTTSIMHDGSVLTRYRLDDRVSGDAIADLYFRQQLISEEIRPFWIGEAGSIEMVDINGRQAEYVQGDWLGIPAQKPDPASSKDLQNLQWTWSSTVEVQQLHWRNLNEQLSLIDIPRSVSDPEERTGSLQSSERSLQKVQLTKNDLARIAEGISRLRQYERSAPILLDYTVKLGDTCTAIAFRYDTTVDALITLNNLMDNCDLITVGQTLRVPLPDERLPLTETDLDCDGNMERLRIVPTPASIDSNISYGVILEALSDIGLYENRWQYTVAEVDAEYLVRPQLFTTGGCQQLLAVNTMGAVEENESGLKIFQWNDNSMKLIFTTDGWLQSVIPYEGGVQLSTLALEYLTGTSTCNRTTAVYTWDGESFSDTDIFVEEGGSCGLR